MIFIYLFIVCFKFYDESCKKKNKKKIHKRMGLVMETCP